MMIDPLSAEEVALPKYNCEDIFISATLNAKTNSRPIRRNICRQKKTLEKSLDAEVIYTCPNAPRNSAKGAGTCPICGMALEPEEITRKIKKIQS